MKTTGLRRSERIAARRLGQLGDVKTPVSTQVLLPLSNLPVVNGTVQRSNHVVQGENESAYVLNNADSCLDLADSLTSEPQDLARVIYPTATLAADTVLARVLPSSDFTPTLVQTFLPLQNAALLPNCCSTLIPFQSSLFFKPFVNCFVPLLPRSNPSQFVSFPLSNVNQFYVQNSPFPKFTLPSSFAKAILCELFFQSLFSESFQNGYSNELLSLILELLSLFQATNGNACKLLSIIGNSEATTRNLFFATCLQYFAIVVLYQSFHLIFVNPSSVATDSNVITSLAWIQLLSPQLANLALPNQYVLTVTSRNFQKLLPSQLEDQPFVFQSNLQVASLNSQENATNQKITDRNDCQTFHSKRTLDFGPSHNPLGALHSKLLINEELFENELQPANTSCSFQEELFSGGQNFSFSDLSCVANKEARVLGADIVLIKELSGEGEEESEIVSDFNFSLLNNFITSDASVASKVTVVASNDYSVASEGSGTNNERWHKALRTSNGGEKGGAVATAPPTEHESNIFYVNKFSSISLSDLQVSYSVEPNNAPEIQCCFQCSKNNYQNFDTLPSPVTCPNLFRVAPPLSSHDNTVSPSLPSETDHLVFKSESNPNYNCCFSKSISSKLFIPPTAGPAHPSLKSYSLPNQNLFDYYFCHHDWSSTEAAKYYYQNYHSSLDKMKDQHALCSHLLFQSSGSRLMHSFDRSVGPISLFDLLGSDDFIFVLLNFNELNARVLNVRDKRVILVNKLKCSDSVPSGAPGFLDLSHLKSIDAQYANFLIVSFINNFFSRIGVQDLFESSSEGSCSLDLQIGGADGGPGATGSTAYCAEGMEVSSGFRGLVHHHLGTRGYISGSCPKPSTGNSSGWGVLEVSKERLRAGGRGGKSCKLGSERVPLDLRRPSIDNKSSSPRMLVHSCPGELLGARKPRRAAGDGCTGGRYVVLKENLGPPIGPAQSQVDEQGNISSSSYADESDTENENESDIKSNSKSKSKNESDSKSKKKKENGIKSKSKSNIKSNSKSKNEKDIKSETKSKNESYTKSKSEIKCDIKSETKSETKSESKEKIKCDSNLAAFKKLFKGKTIVLLNFQELQPNNFAVDPNVIFLNKDAKSDLISRYFSGVLDISHLKASYALLARDTIQSFNADYADVQGAKRRGVGKQSKNTASNELQNTQRFKCLICGKNDASSFAAFWDHVRQVHAKEGIKEQSAIVAMGFRICDHDDCGAIVKNVIGEKRHKKQAHGIVASVPQQNRKRELSIKIPSSLKARVLPKSVKPGYNLEMDHPLNNLASKVDEALIPTSQGTVAVQFKDALKGISAKRLQPKSKSAIEERTAADLSTTEQVIKRSKVQVFQELNDAVDHESNAQLDQTLTSADLAEDHYEPVDLAPFEQELFSDFLKNPDVLELLVNEEAGVWVSAEVKAIDGNMLTFRYIWKQEACHSQVNIVDDAKLLRPVFFESNLKALVMQEERRRALANRGMRIFPIQGDGNCLF